MKNTLFSLMGIALTQTLLELLIEDARFRQILRFLAGAAMAVILIGAVTDFDYDAYASALRRQEIASDWNQDRAEAERQRLDRLFIEAETEAYIMDRAETLGVSLSGVRVSFRWNSDGYWYPDRVTLTGSVPPSLRSEIADALRTELGIPEERQTWSEEETDHGSE